MDLNDPRIDGLINVIKDSFRVRPNQDPIYVDVSGNLPRIEAKQHQVVFGRRGSGKSCLLVHFHRSVAPGDRIKTIYVEADEIKRLGYPDILIRLLLTLTEELPGPRRKWVQKLLRRAATPLESQASELRALLDLAERSDVTAEGKEASDHKVEAQLKHGPAGIGGSAGTSSGSARTSVFKEEKLDALERHFSDYKRVLSDAVDQSSYEAAAVIVDDFYLFHLTIQPDLVDYLHRLLRGTHLYLKLGTVRFRTALMRHDGQPIGIDPSQDVEEINLDRTFEDVESTADFLSVMLGSMAKKQGIHSLDELISEEGRLALTLASGGVPRDYLNTLVDGIEAARASGQARVTPKSVYKGAGRVSYRTKLRNLREDTGEEADAIELVFRDLFLFCLREKKKTAFLISQDEVSEHAREHEMIQQLMDFKLIHVIESDTSAASGRSGRYEAYTLDFALFMEPRLRGIEHVEFWLQDEQRRPLGVREAPAYPLSRARSVMSEEARSDLTTEAALEQLEGETGADEPGDTLTGADTLL
jgi:energy-coupling factor transporter ATP-binding protein EcfA2